MEDISKFIEYKGCSSCIANSTNSCKYCEKCEVKFKISSNKNIEYEDFKNDEAQKGTANYIIYIKHNLT
jgi:benzoyl-CoA reductase/2-hydroxyglutaryl-CoA dehydratase subunit BcrC/BadD/HgdB